MTDFDYTAAAEVRFAEDLDYSDVAPLLDALARSPVFRVGASRVAWSGPAAGGPEVGLVLSAMAVVGGSAFAKKFCEELATDAYRAVRAAVIALARRLRERDTPRAVVAVVIEVGTLQFCLGSFVREPPAPDEWTDEWLIERLRDAQAIVDKAGSVVGPQPLEPRLMETGTTLGALMETAAARTSSLAPLGEFTRVAQTEELTKAPLTSGIASSLLSFRPRA